MDDSDSTDDDQDVKDESDPLAAGNRNNRKNLTEFEELWQNFTAHGLKEKDDVSDDNFDPEAAIYKRKLLIKKVFSDTRPTNTV